MIAREAQVLLRPSPQYAYLPECPRQLTDGRLLWITIQLGSSGELATRGALHTVDLESGEGMAWEIPGRPGFALPSDREETFLVGLERKIGWLDLHAGTFEPVVDDLDAHCEGTIVNDAEPFEHGVVFGMKDTAFRDHKAGLYFLRSRDGELFQLSSDQLCSNGKVVRMLDQRHAELLNVDSPTRRVQRSVLDIENGTMTPPKTVIDLTSERAGPRGMIAGPGEDKLVIAMFDPEDADYGRAILCALDSGEIIAEYRTPGAMQVTCPAWVNAPAGPQLLLTTAAENLTGERLANQPNAGCLFVVELDAP